MPNSQKNLKNSDLLPQGLSTACLNDKPWRLFLKLFWARTLENNLPQAAGYLTYSTMLAFVPLIMVVFSIFSAFPVFHDISLQLQDFIYQNFAPGIGETVGKYLQQFVENSRQMSAIGIVSLIIVALMLIHSIDTTLNRIWENTEKRSAMSSFTIYWMILTLGPIVITISVAVSSYLTLVANDLTSDWQLPFRLELLKIVPFILAWGIFTLIYLLVPNTEVNWRDSAAGALIAAIFFTLGKQVFNWYITTFPSYHLIYGAMATLPILLLWLQLSWLAILAGAQLAAVLQNLRLIRQFKQENSQ